MVSKLPKWVEIGAFLLTFIAGSVNAIGLLGFSHQSVSHLSGIATRLGFELAHLNGINSIHLGLILGSFLLGAIFSGFYIRSSALTLGRRYNIALFIEGIVLLIAMVVLKHGSFMGHYFASAACGLQNAMVSTYSGAVIRTTHVTGVFTDLGIMIGSRLQGVPYDRRRCTLYVVLIVGFIGGGISGSICFERFGFTALLLPACLSIFLSVLHIYYSALENVT